MAAGRGSWQVGRMGLADAMTIANGICGFVAIGLLIGMPADEQGWGSTMFDGSLGVVLALLAAGLTFDALDGAVARWRGSSGYGDQLDPICDAITFGAVPPLLLLQSPAADGATGSAAALAVAALYFTAVIVRLAVNASDEGHAVVYTGLPSPPAAVLVLTVLVLAPATPIALLGIAAVALMMVSPYSLPHPGTLGMVLMTVLACTWATTAFTGWLPGEAALSLTIVSMLLIGPIETAAGRVAKRSVMLRRA